MRMLAIAICLMLQPSFAPAAKPTSTAVVTAADLAGPALQGRPARPGDKGVKMLVLEFWASWCGPCRESLPHTEKLRKKYTKRGVRFVAVSADDDVKSARSFLEDVEFGFPAILDQDKKLVTKLKLDSIPTMVMLDSKGHVVGVERGFTRAKKKRIANALDRVLKRIEKKDI